MANWSMDSTGNYDAEQAERIAVFNKIKPRGHWKNHINCWIDEADFAECSEAAIWFTGAPLEIVRYDGKKKKVQVTAPGYYAVIGT